ncbi:hypothetical protein C8Q70DRAFT_953896 [Cubamyces menziesii]|nr:hypothetical protein C8Q70DRAFT_953896 [Cubamyces menziesii]
MIAFWDIYTKELFDLVYGRPLWAPEPSRIRTVHIGDVTRLHLRGSLHLRRQPHASQGDPAYVRGTLDGYVPLKYRLGLCNVTPISIPRRSCVRAMACTRGLSPVKEPLAFCRTQAAQRPAYDTSAPNSQARY